MNTMDESSPTPHDLMTRFVRNVRERDLDALVALYAPEAVFRPAEGPIARGHAEIRAALAEMLALQPKLEAQVEEVVLVGDLALVVSRWTMQATAPDGTLLEQAGRSSDVVQFNGTTWRILIDRP